MGGAPGRSPSARANDDFLWERHYRNGWRGLLCEKQKLELALVEYKTEVQVRVRVPRITTASTRPSRAKRST